jgi:hypothetical protein
VTTFGETCSYDASRLESGWNYTEMQIPDIMYRDGDYMVEIVYAVLHDTPGVFWPTMTVEVEGLCRDGYHHDGPDNPTHGGLAPSVSRVVSTNTTMFRVPLAQGNKPAPSRTFPSAIIDAQPSEVEPRAVFYGRDITKFHIGKVVQGMSPSGMWRWRVPIPWYMNDVHVDVAPVPMMVILEFQFYPNSFK